MAKIASNSVWWPFLKVPPKRLTDSQLQRLLSALRAEVLRRGIANTAYPGL